MTSQKNKKIVILGAGTAGTMVANHLAKAKKYDITIVDQYEHHYYQPGFLFLPFGTYKKEDIIKPKTSFLPKGTCYIQDEIDRIDAANNQVLLVGSEKIDYDLLVIATGAKINPKETPGMAESEWHKSIFDFYTIEGAAALGDYLKDWQGGTMAVHITEMPIKCPVAPLEFTFLADSFFKEKGIRDKVKLKFVTPLDGAFTKPTASEKLGYLLEQKNIEVVPDFNVEHIDPKAKKLVSYDEKEVAYDLLVTVPTNMGDSMIERSGLGDELNFVPVNQHTLQSDAHANIFVIGDATNVPASKAGSVAHFQTNTLIKNIANFFVGKKLEESFDGHANCFVETGNKKAMLIDFNYDQEPVTGAFPLPLIGPMRLLKESRLNHIGKHAFRWIYWHLLLKARPIPGIPARMSLVGKKIKK